MMNIINKTKREVDKKYLQKVADLTLNDCSKDFSILFTNNKTIRKYNKNFRKKDYATNVLSFPSDVENYLGDVIISLEKIEEETIEQGKGFLHHLTHMIVHSLLHLLRFDHKKPDERRKMEAMEVKILKKLNIKNPYIIYNHETKRN